MKPFYFLDREENAKTIKKTKVFGKWISGITHCPYCGNGLLELEDGSKACIGCEVTADQIKQELDDCDAVDEARQEGLC